MPRLRFERTRIIAFPHAFVKRFSTPRVAPRDLHGDPLATAKFTTALGIKPSTIIASRWCLGGEDSQTARRRRCDERKGQQGRNSNEPVATDNVPGHQQVVRDEVVQYGLARVTAPPEASIRDRTEQQRRHTACKKESGCAFPARGSRACTDSHHAGAQTDGPDLYEFNARKKLLLSFLFGLPSTGAVMIGRLLSSPLRARGGLSSLRRLAWSSSDSPPLSGAQCMRDTVRCACMCRRMHGFAVPQG